MCIAICVPPNQTIDKKVLLKCWNNNPHGAGFMYVDITNTKLVVQKGIMKFKHLIQQLNIAQKNARESWFVIHFRFASRGGMGARNTHPHVIVKDQSAIVHNGTIHNEACTNESDSDTVIFTNNILAALPLDFTNSYGIRCLIEDYLGTGKMVYLDVHNCPVIYNELLGETVGDVWYSNTYYKTNRGDKKPVDNFSQQGQWNNPYTNDIQRCEHCGAILFYSEEYNKICRTCMKHYENYTGSNNTTPQCVAACEQCGLELQMQFEINQNRCSHCLEQDARYNINY